MPYTLADLRSILTELTGDVGFANAFFDRYVEGRETIDYATLLSAVGVSLVRNAAVGWIGGSPPVAVDGAAIRLGAARPGPGEWLAPFGTPIYAAGLDGGDRLLSIDGQPASLARWQDVLRRRPGERIALTGARRNGQAFSTTLEIGVDPGRWTSVPLAALTAAERQRRAAWLGSRVPVAAR